MVIKAEPNEETGLINDDGKMGRVGLVGAVICLATEYITML
jgi:hypothetical protein